MITLHEYIKFDEADLKDPIVKGFIVDTRDFACYLTDKQELSTQAFELPSNNEYKFTREEIIYLITKWRNIARTNSIIRFDLDKYPVNSWDLKYITFVSEKENWFIKSRSNLFLSRDCMDWTPIHGWLK